MSKRNISQHSARKILVWSGVFVRGTLLESSYYRIVAAKVAKRALRGRCGRCMKITVLQSNLLDALICRDGKGLLLRNTNERSWS